MSQYCPKCGTQLLIGGKFCPRCGANVEQQTMQPIFTPQPVTQSSTQPSINTTTQTQQYGASSLWYQNYYRIRKTLTVGNKYWLEDQSGAILGFVNRSFSN